MMTEKKQPTDDPRYHFEIWTGPSPEFDGLANSIYYVENHNAQCSYSELAHDFSFAVPLLIKQWRDTQLGNWMAPVAHLSRHLVELRLKALMSAARSLDSALDVELLGRHNLEAIWLACRNWLTSSGYRVLDDARLEMTERLISAFHEIDPSGDLFRFGTSRQTAFEKRKSYDRVGIVLDQFERELHALEGCLGHWEATLVRESIKKEMAWDVDPFFDADAFPKRER